MNKVDIKNFLKLVKTCTLTILFLALFSVTTQMAFALSSVDDASFVPLTSFVIVTVLKNGQEQQLQHPMTMEFTISEGIESYTEIIMARYEIQK